MSMEESVNPGVVDELSKVLLSVARGRRQPGMARVEAVRVYFQMIQMGATFAAFEARQQQEARPDPVPES